MATVRDLIKGSLRLIGAIAATETPTADEQADALSALNQMIASWSNESLFLFENTREEFTLTANDGDYTMGASGNFNTTRPIEIISAMIEDQSSSPTSEYPVDILRTIKDWAEIRTKDLSAAIPTQLYIEWGNPLITLNLYPKPSAANKLVLYSKKPIAAFASANETLSLPPGYEKALKFNLCVDLAPEYSKEASASIVRQAIESKSNIKRKNTRPRYLVADGAVRGNSNFDIYAGE